jgi:hypothetical protein
VTSTKKLGATGLVAALAATSLAAATLAGPATAVPSAPVFVGATTTAGINGATVSFINIATPYGATPKNVALTAVQNGADIDFTIQVQTGPDVVASTFEAGKYRVDAFVRLNGVENTRGTRFAGPVGDVDVDAPNSTFANGLTITGKFPGVGDGNNKLTLTDLLLDYTGGSSGGLGDTPTGADAYYNSGTTVAQIRAGRDWGIPETSAPKVTVGKINKTAAKVKALKGTIADVGNAGPASVTVKAVQKRDKKWFAFTGKTWKKQSTKGKAVKKAKALTDTTVSSGKWKVKIKKVKPGKLVVKYSGADTLGNVAKTKTKTVKLA